jgi:hypothetical protein
VYNSGSIEVVSVKIIARDKYMLNIPFETGFLLDESTFTKPVPVAARSEA